MHAAIPVEMLRPLEAAGNRVRRLLLIKGMSMTLSFALGMILVVMLADAVVSLESPWVRSVLLVLIGIISLRQAWHWLVKPLAIDLSPARMARVLEGRHPELLERVSTALEIGNGSPALAGVSPELYENLVREASASMAGMNPDMEFQFKAIRRPLTAFGILLAICLVLTAWNPGMMFRLASRLVMPFANQDNAWATEIEVLPGDSVALKGEPLAVTVTGEPIRGTTPYIEWVDENNQWQRERMLGIIDGEGFRHVVPVLRHTLEYRIRAGRALTRIYRVQAEDRPTLVAMNVKVTPPSYTGHPEREQTLDSSGLVVLAGSTLQFTPTFNKPLQRTDWTWAAQPVTWTRSEGDLRFLENIPVKSGPLSLEMTDPHGFTGRSPEWPLAVLPDLPPRAEWIEPQATQLRLNPNQYLRMRFLVFEDVGLHDAHILVKVAGRELPPIAISTPTPLLTAPGYYEGEAALDISRLALEGASDFVLRIRVGDTLPADRKGPQYGYTPELRITLDHGAQSLARQTHKEQVEKLQRAIAATQDQLNQALGKAQNNAERLAKEEVVPDWIKNELERMAEELANAERAASEAAAALDNSAVSELAKSLEDVARNAIQEARAAADQIPVQDTPEARAEAAKETAEAIKNALEELVEMRKETEERRQELEQAARLQDLADRQQRLADQAETTEDAKKWQQEQRQAATETAELAKSNEAWRAEAEAMIAEHSRDLLAEASDLAQAQQAVAEASRQSSENQPLPTSAAEQLAKALASEQKAIADDLASLADKAAEAAKSPPSATTPDASSPSADASPEQADTPSPQQPEPDASSSQPSGQSATPDASNESSPSSSSPLQQAAEAAAKAAESIAANNFTEAKQQAQASSENISNALNPSPSNAPSAPDESSSDAGDPGAGSDPPAAQPAGAESAQGAAEQGAGEQGTGEQGAGEQGAGEQGAGEQGAGEQGTGEQGAGEQGAGEQGAAEQGAAEQGAGEQGDASDGAAMGSEKGDASSGDAAAESSGSEGQGAGESESSDSPTGEAAGEGENPSGTGSASEAGGTPESSPAVAPISGELAQEAASLQARQEQVLAALDALNEGQFAEAAALAQEALSARESEFAAEAAGVAQAAAALGFEPSQAGSLERAAAALPSQAQSAAEAAQAASEAAQAAGEAAQAAADAGNTGSPAEGASGSSAAEQAQASAAQAASAQAAAQAAASQAAAAQGQAAASLAQAAESLQQLAAAAPASSGESSADASSSGDSDAGSSASSEAASASADPSASPASAAPSSPTGSPPGESAQGSSGEGTPSAPATPGQQVAAALQSGFQAAQSPGTPQAAAQSASAAQALQAAAQALAQSSSSSAQSAQMLAQQQGQGEASFASAVPGPAGAPISLATLQRLGMSSEEWSRLNGLLQSGVSGAETEGIPGEYRDLVQKYYQALSREGARQTTPATP